MSNTQPWSDMRSRSQLRQSRPAMPSGVVLISPSPVIGAVNSSGSTSSPNSTASLVALARSRAWIRTLGDSNQLQRHQAASSRAAIAQQDHAFVRALA